MGFAERAVAMHLRVVTYNVHKCRGMDRRVHPGRILRVLTSIDADVVALQEVLSQPGAPPENDQAGYFARQLGFHLALGENRRLRGAAYGNAVLSRFPLGNSLNCDLSVAGRERRGCFRTEVLYRSGRCLRVFNVHLGTGFFERRRQADMLQQRLAESKDGSGVRIVLGDFNEWTRGLTSRMLANSLRSADLRAHLKYRRSYPGLLPVLHLDHIYYEAPLELESIRLCRSPAALMASDHLPLVADFHLAE